MNWVLDQLQKKDFVLISWIHSHVGGVPCGFSSIDMHSQFLYERAYPGILGTVFQINVCFGWWSKTIKRGFPILYAAGLEPRGLY